MCAHVDGGSKGGLSDRNVTMFLPTLLTLVLIIIMLLLLPWSSLSRVSVSLSCLIDFLTLSLIVWVGWRRRSLAPWPHLQKYIAWGQGLCQHIVVQYVHQVHRSCDNVI